MSASDCTSPFNCCCECWRDLFSFHFFVFGHRGEESDVLFTFTRDFGPEPKCKCVGARARCAPKLQPIPAHIVNTNNTYIHTQLIHISDTVKHMHSCLHLMRESLWEKQVHRWMCAGCSLNKWRRRNSSNTSQILFLSASIASNFTRWLVRSIQSSTELKRKRTEN